jgi:DNA-binding response OmpR family regulator
MEAGGDYYMTKPFEYRELLQVIGDLLGSNTRGDSNE